MGIWMRRRLLSLEASRSSLMLRKFACIQFVFGTTSVLIGTSLETLFLPKCPEGCMCTEFVTIYPWICIGVGGFWLAKGFQIMRSAAQRNRQYHELSDESSEQDEPSLMLGHGGPVPVVDVNEPPPPYVVVEPMEPRQSQSSLFTGEAPYDPKSSGTNEV
jgi:hypothetical protein